MASKLGINTLILTTGIIGNFDIEDDDDVRFVTENANPGNTIIIRMKLKEQTSWTTIRTISGTKEEVLKTDTYDQLQVECTTLDGTNVKLLASGFNNDGN